MLVYALAGCVVSVDERAHSAHLVASTRGSAVVISADERIAVATHRSTGTVTVYRLDPSRPLAERITGATDIDLGEGSEPWAAALGTDDRAFVVLRNAGRVVQIDHLHGQPRSSTRVDVGAEPTAIAMSPSGSRLFIANFGEGTISVVRTSDLLHVATIDLNRAIHEHGTLGSVPVRAGLAHPRALTLTDDGDADDDDETLYATEFFSQPVPRAEHSGNRDLDRQGLVYAVPLRSGLPGPPITLSAVSNTGYPDARGKTTDCFPNQLYAAALDGPRLLVSAMCTSPRGPVGSDSPSDAASFKSLMHPALFVVDTRDNQARPERTLLLSRELDRRQVEDGADAGQLRLPLIANDLAVSAPARDGSVVACLSALGADALFCMDFLDGTLRDIGTPGARYVDMRSSAWPTGRLPTGVALGLASQRPFALVIHDGTRALHVVDLAARTVAQRYRETPATPRVELALRADAHVGRADFATGLEVWSYQGEARSSCEACHPDGLSDGVVWEFARGPRRTLSLANTNVDGAPRLMLWTANIDEVHDVEAIVRSVSGGMGAILRAYPKPAKAPPASTYDDFRIYYDGKERPQSAKRSPLLLHGLNGSLAHFIGSADCRPDAEVCANATTDNWNAITAYVLQVRAPHAPVVRSEDAQQVIDYGRTLFERGRCPFCHAGPASTLSRRFYAPGAEANGALSYFAGGELGDPGALRARTYTVGEPHRHLNPPAREAGSATLRLMTPDPAELRNFLYAPTTQLRDQLNCALRHVGTYGVSALDAPPVVEERLEKRKTDGQDQAAWISVPALGGTGFNTPGLRGLALSGPYFHAGNARSLEELFAPEFNGHTQAANPSFLTGDPASRAADVAALVRYLLSIDADTPPHEALVDSDFCAQVVP